VVDVLDQVRGVEGERSAVGAAAAAAVRVLRRGVVALGTV
jgi:ATP-dependent RNA helicase HelY